MDLYHSRLTQDDLKDLIIKYKIPRDLHPRLPFKEFVMSELLDDAIGIYHRMIDFFGVCIPFSSFLLAFIKHYRVYFSQLGPLGLNKGDWFYFAKRRAPSSVCIDDNRSCMKHWKSGFFLIDRRATPNSIVWRHLSTAIDDPRPAASSFNMADVRRLSTHVIKLRDMPEGVLVLFGLSPVWKSCVSDLVLWVPMEMLWRLPFYCTHPVDVNAVISDPTPEDLAVGTPSAKILAKAEASEKRKAFTSGATSSHDGSSITPAAEGPGTRDSQGKGIMVDDVVAPPIGVSPLRPSSGPASSFRDVSKYDIHTYFFPFSVGPYYAAYPEGGVAGNCEFTRKEWDAPYRPNFGVLTKEVFKDPVVYKTVCVALHDMSHGGELLARYRGLWLQRHVAGLSDKLSYSDVAFAKSKAKGKERKKKIKSLTKSLDQLNVEGIMVDDVVAPPIGVSPLRPSSGPASSFRDVSKYDIHTYFFPFSVGPYYAAYPEGGVAGNCEFTRKEWDDPYRPTFEILTKEVFKDPVVYKTVVDQFPTPRERVWVKTLSEDQLTAKMSVLHCMICRMMLQRKVAGLSGNLSSSDVAFAKSKAKGKERKKKIKSLTKSLDQLNAEVTHLSTALNQAIVPEAEKDEEILRLKAIPPEVQGELFSLASSTGFKRGLSMHRTKDEFAALLKKMAHFMPVHRVGLLKRPPLLLKMIMPFSTRGRIVTLGP
ncbi:hypothetical protein Tco_0913404 [Tanacetum coccineum]